MYQENLRADMETRSSSLDAGEGERKRERKYWEIVKNAPAGIYEFDYRNKRLLWVNDSMCKITGYSRKELLDINPLDLLDNRSQVLFQARMEQWLNGQLPADNVDYFIKTKGGRKMCVELYFDFIFDEAGAPKGATVVAHDITGRKRTEEALWESREKYRTLFNSIDEGFCIIEVLFDDNDYPVDYRFLEVNQAFERQGYFKNVTGRCMRDISPGHDQHWFDIYGRIALTGEPVRFQDSVQSLGRFYDVYAFRVGKPQQRRVAVLFYDITALKETEEALRESKERQEFLLNLSDALRPVSDPVEIQGIVARVTMDFFNADRCYYCEIEDDQAIVRRDASSGDLPSVAGVYPLSWLPVYNSLIEAVQPIIVSDVQTTSMVDEELRQFFIRFSVISYLDIPVIKDGKPVGLLCITQSRPRIWKKAQVDLAEEVAERMWTAVERAKTEEKKKEAEILLQERNEQALELVDRLRQLDQNKNTFINMLSHELRNPLASIMMSLDLLDKMPADGNKAKMAREIAKRQGRQLTRLVDDLLDVTRITQNKVALKKEWIELNDLIKTAIEDYQFQLAENNVKLEVSLTSPLYLEADSSRLTQAIGSLLDNAAKFSGNNAVVTVTIAGDTNAGEAVVTIGDTGWGINPDYLDILFEPFIQFDQPLDRRHGGLGLGLAIVKGMIELHGGKVEAFSEGRDKGSTFTVRLPLPKENVGEQEECERKEPQSNKPLTVLLIEDNKDLVEVLCELIAFVGYEVKAAYTGTAGLAKAQELKPDVVICDIGLPGISGYEVGQSIRKDPELQDIFLIALSGYAQPEDIQRSKEAGFDQHLGKPVSIETLQEVLNNQNRD